MREILDLSISLEVNAVDLYIKMELKSRRKRPGRSFKSIQSGKKSPEATEQSFGKTLRRKGDPPGRPYMPRQILTSMIPEFPQFKPLQLEDRDFLGEKIWEYQPQTSEWTFTNLFLWRSHMGSSGPATRIGLLFSARLVPRDFTFSADRAPLPTRSHPQVLPMAQGRKRRKKSAHRASGLKVGRRD